MPRSDPWFSKDWKRVWWEIILLLAWNSHFSSISTPLVEENSWDQNSPITYPNFLSLHASLLYATPWLFLPTRKEISSIYMDFRALLYYKRFDIAPPGLVDGCTILLLCPKELSIFSHANDNWIKHIWWGRGLLIRRQDWGTSNSRDDRECSLTVGEYSGEDFGHLS